MSDGNEKLYDFVSRSDASGLHCVEPSLTVQSGKDDADINVIVRRFGITGQLPENVNLPTYADYDEVFDFHTAQQRILDAEVEFMKLPADIRSEFKNDPGIFFDIASNPENIDYLRDLGLAKPKVLEETIVPVNDVVK